MLINLGNIYQDVTPQTDAQKALLLPPFGKSDHNSILLIPAYKQKLKQEVLVTRSIRKWSDDVEAKLQDCFASRTKLSSLQQCTVHVINVWMSTFLVAINILSVGTQKAI